MIFTAKVAHKSSKYVQTMQVKQVPLNQQTGDIEDLTNTHSFSNRFPNKSKERSVTMEAFFMNIVKETIGVES